MSKFESNLLVKPPVVGVILLNWNGLRDTQECVQSLLESSYSSLEIYIVDNASLNNEAETLKHQFPDVHVLPQTQNLGFCKGNNVGISKAVEDGAEYILVLNNDTIVPADTVDKLVSTFVEMPHAGAISPVILVHPSEEQVWFARAEWDYSRAQFSLNPEKSNYAELKNKATWRSEFAVGCCLLTSSKIFTEVGLLDERYFAYYDEADWCSRLEKKGYLSFVTSSTLIYHKVSQSTPGPVSTYLMARNRLLWMKENLSFYNRMRSFTYLGKEFIWHILNNWGIVKGGYTRQHSKAFLWGWLDFRLGRFGHWGKKVQQVFSAKK
jgi:GT2 family glycosyltransferase